VFNDDVVAMARLSDEAIRRIVHTEEQEIARRERQYRGDRAPAQLGGRTIILIDDGLATGATMRAAVQAIQTLQPARLIVAVPVGVSEACAALRATVDEVVCVATPEPFRAVGVWYQVFDQTTDAEVRDLLDRNWRTLGALATPDAQANLPANDGGL
jgi:putative phosphoribosyl transferase